MVSLIKMGDDLEGDPDEVIKSCRLGCTESSSALSRSIAEPLGLSTWGADSSGIVTLSRVNHPTLMQASRTQDDVPEGCRNT